MQGNPNIRPLEMLLSRVWENTDVTALRIAPCMEDLRPI